jgi:dTDP-4-amino-4,6-dideoxygalactose transaminase
VHQYCVRHPERDRLAAALAARGVGTAVYYPRPLHHQPALAGCRAAPTPVAVALCAEILALPIHDVDETAVDIVLAAIAEVT